MALVVAVPFSSKTTGLPETVANTKLSVVNPLPSICIMA